MTKLWITIVCGLSFIAPALPAQVTAPSTEADLKFVVYFSRHGVRSPTGKAAQYDKYSTGAWPTWDVAPGILTPHGYHLIELLGAYDRFQLLHQGLLTADDCADVARVTFYADSDQRTRETGKAFAKGIFPHCDVSVPSLAQGTNDPLFHLPPSAVADSDSAQAVAAIAGRIGGDVKNVTQAYRSQLQAFDDLLATCGNPSSGTPKRTSLLAIPVELSGGQGDHLADLRGPLNTASTLTENLLLEYTEGLPDAQVGWGCIDGAKIRTLIGIHTAATDFTQRTPIIAKQQSANLLSHITQSINQAVQHKEVSGALSKPNDLALFLVGHDTNIINMAGALSLTWIADGRRDDTAPGSTLIFELWKNRQSGEYSVKLYLTVQTLEQMRFSKPLSAEAPPVRVPVFVPGCSRADSSCSWPSFQQAVEAASH